MMELITCKGCYEACETVAFTLRCGDETAKTAAVTVTRLQVQVAVFDVRLTGPETLVEIPAMFEEGAGYGVRAEVTGGGKTIGVASTAFSIGRGVVRYGFLSDFLPHCDADIESLAKYHITHVQFYDWAYRHDTLIAPENEYTDMMGKRNSLSAVKAKIASCHQRGMLAMAYGAVYAAGRSFWETHKAWGLYAKPGAPMVFIDTFYIMDIESPWRDHLLKQYMDAVEQAGFDGIHMDAYGEPKRALTAQGETRDLEHGFPALIRDTDAALRRAGHAPHLIFNNVGAWPVEATRGEPQDAVYIELWPPMDRYRHIRQAIELARGGGRPVVLAAYPAPFRTDTPKRALYCELFLSFAIALGGATQLFLGEENAVITQGYYADYRNLLPFQMETIKAYQDFFVCYQELLFDRSLRDVSLTHCGGDNREYGCSVPFSPEGEADKLWLSFRENSRRKLIGMINLRGNQDDHWNLGKDAPMPPDGFTLHVLAHRKVGGVWYASPDRPELFPCPLEYEAEESPYGTDIKILVPHLDCCGLVWLDMPPA